MLTMVEFLLMWSFQVESACCPVAPMKWSHGVLELGASLEAVTFGPLGLWNMFKEFQHLEESF